MTAMLVEYSTDLGVVVIVAGMALCLARLLRGPHLADRAMAADALVTHLMALVVLLTIRMRSLLMVDAVLVLALLGFVTTIAVAQYIVRPHLRRFSSTPPVPPEGETSQ